MKIIFMGTPDFAVPPLTALCRHGYAVEAVVTQPDRPKGRGRKVVFPPVKQTASDLDLEIIQPDSIRTQWFEDRVREIAPDLLVVVAFGHVLPKQILTLPKMGAVNVHASLLPQYRGAAPIHWAVINGEKQTGITTMHMDAGLDTGDILLTEAMAIRNDDTAGTLHDRLAELGADLLVRTLTEIESGGIRPVPQDHSSATYAPMLKKKDGCIDWTLPARRIESFIRGMNPWPGAFTYHENRLIKIFRADVARMESTESPGRVIRGFADELRVATGDKALSILELQGESGKRLPVSAFLRGSAIEPGATFDSSMKK